MRAQATAVLFVGVLTLVGCDEIRKKNPTTPSASASPEGSSSPPEVAPHGPVTVNALASSTPPWRPGTRSIDPAFASGLEANAKAGPVRLVMADMSQIPRRMSEARFNGRENVQYYALSRSYAGFDWRPGNDGEAQGLYDQSDQIVRWWQVYVDAVVSVMQRQPNLTVLVIENDGHDRLGRTLGGATQRAFPGSLQGRVELGRTVPD